MKRRKIVVGVVFLALCASLLAGCSSTSVSESEDKMSGTTAEVKEEEVESAPVFGEFETLTLNGEAASQELFAESKLTMVNIWGTFCGPCIREMPELAELSEEYADSGVQIVGMLSDVTNVEDEKAANAREIVATTGADYTHLILSQDLYDNYMNQVQVVPTTVFVDREGRQVGKVYTGARDKAAWAAIVEELLEQTE